MARYQQVTAPETTSKPPARYEGVVCATGAVTLALEVLASRIMTPYFGVSLYIWTGILSITLIFLACGYYLGGRVAARSSPARLHALFLAMPMVSAWAVLLACMLYPWTFPRLATQSLILGSFLAGTILLATPLVALSALNPFLIAMKKHSVPDGDAGAGRVFFVSTLGSVGGVLLTAFVFIPNVTNFTAMLCLGLSLSGMALSLMGLAHDLSPRAQRLLLGGSVTVAVLLLGMLVGKTAVLRLMAESAHIQSRFVIRAEYTSIFGNVKVVQVAADDEEPFLALLQDGLMQNRTTLQGTSLSPYTYALDTLARGFAPSVRQALVLGLGAGSVPGSLARDGVQVTVVEINPLIPQVAAQFFAFRPQNIRLHIEDARTFVHRCHATFDVVIVDLFQGDSTPDYLLTQEFFRDVRQCAQRDGIMVMNTFTDEQSHGPMRRLLATIATAFPYVFEFRSPHGNAYLVANASGVLPTSLRPRPDTPTSLLTALNDTLTAVTRFTPAILADYAPIADDHNVFSVLFAPMDMEQRRLAARLLPFHLLVN